MKTTLIPISCFIGMLAVSVPCLSATPSDATIYQLPPSLQVARAELSPTDIRLANFLQEPSSESPSDLGGEPAVTGLKPAIVNDISTDPAPAATPVPEPEPSAAPAPIWDRFEPFPNRSCCEPSCGVCCEPSCGVCCEPSCGCSPFEPTCGCSPCEPTCGVSWCEPTCGIDSCDACGCDGMGGGYANPCALPSDGYWKLRGGALFMQRSDPDDEPLITANPNLNPVVFSSGAFSFDFEPGYEIFAARGVGGTGTEIQLRYFAVDGWTDTHASQGSGFSFSLATRPPTGLVGFGLNQPPTANLSGTYASNLYNYEFNVRQSVLSDSVGLLIGFRHLTLDEQLSINGSIPNFNTPFGSQTRTENNLFGLQLGGDLRTGFALGSSSCVNFGSTILAGIYGADTKQQTSIPVTFLGGFNTNANGRDGSLAFVGELSFDSSVRVGPASLFTEYRLMWIEGVALASDQIGATSFSPLSPSSNINTSGGAFYHGLQVGLEFLF